MTKRIYLFMSVVLGVLFLAGCTALAASPPPTEEPTAVPAATAEPVSAVVMSYAEKLSAGDLEGTLSYFHDDAVFYILGLPPEGFEMLNGKEQISTMFEENIASNFKMEVEVLSVYEDVVKAKTTTWHDFTREIGVAPVEATGVYVIKDGKITTEAWHVSAGSLAKFKTALAEIMPAEPEAEPVVDTAVSEITVTFADSTCAYEGPMALQAGPIAVTVDVQDLDKEKYAFSAFNLDPEKDFADLMASTIGLPPSWADILSLEEVPPGENSQFEFTVEKGPVYVVCWSKPPDLAIGAIGPFGVAE